MTHSRGKGRGRPPALARLDLRTSQAHARSREIWEIAPGAMAPVSKTCLAEWYVPPAGTTPLQLQAGDTSGSSAAHFGFRGLGLRSRPPPMRQANSSGFCVWRRLIGQRQVAEKQLLPLASMDRLGWLNRRDDPPPHNLGKKRARPTATLPPCNLSLSGAAVCRSSRYSSCMYQCTGSGRGHCYFLLVGDEICSPRPI